MFFGFGAGGNGGRQGQLVALAHVEFLEVKRGDFLAEDRWGSTSLQAVGGIWSVLIALFAAILVLLALNPRRLTQVRETMDAGANASVLPALSVASLVGFAQ